MILYQAREHIPSFKPKKKAARWSLINHRHRFLYNGLFHLRLTCRCFDLTHFQNLHKISVRQLSGAFLESGCPTLRIVQFAREPFSRVPPFLLLVFQSDDALCERLLPINAGGGDDAGSRAVAGKRSTLVGCSGSVSGTRGGLHDGAGGGNELAPAATA